MNRNFILPTIICLTACTPGVSKDINLTPIKTEMRIPIITSTPYNISLDNDEEIARNIKQLYSISCLGPDLSEITPPADVPAPSELHFLEVEISPDPSIYWVFEIADNFENNYQAFTACKPDACQEKIYVKDKANNEVYEIDWGPKLPRDIGNIIWINNAVFAFSQSSSPHYGRIIAINYDERIYEYFAVVSDEC